METSSPISPASQALQHTTLAVPLHGSPSGNQNGSQRVYQNGLGRFAQLGYQQNVFTGAPSNPLNWASLRPFTNDTSHGGALNGASQLSHKSLPHLSSDAKTRTEQIGQLVSGSHSYEQRQLLQHKAWLAETSANARRDEVRLTVIGAGPTGQIQALKAAQAGATVSIIEGRNSFTRTNIFQINNQDFTQSVGQYLSAEVVDQLEVLGVVHKERISACSMQRSGCKGCICGYNKGFRKYFIWYFKRSGKS